MFYYGSLGIRVVGEYHACCYLTPPPTPSLNFGFLPAIPLEVGRIGNPTYLAAFAAQ